MARGARTLLVRAVLAIVKIMKIKDLKIFSQFAHSMGIILLTLSFVMLAISFIYNDHSKAWLVPVVLLCLAAFATGISVNQSVKVFSEKIDALENEIVELKSRETETKD